MLNYNIVSGDTAFDDSLFFNYLFLNLGQNIKIKFDNH